MRSDAARWSSSTEGQQLRLAAEVSFIASVSPRSLLIRLILSVMYRLLMNAYSASTSRVADWAVQLDRWKMTFVIHRSPIHQLPTLHRVAKCTSCGCSVHVGNIISMTLFHPISFSYIKVGTAAHSHRTNHHYCSFDTSLNSRLSKQETQLSHRGCATLRVIEYFAKPLKVTKGHWQLYHWKPLVQFPIRILDRGSA